MAAAKAREGDFLFVNRYYQYVPLGSLKRTGTTDESGRGTNLTDPSVNTAPRTLN